MKLFGTDGIRTRAGEFPLNAAAIPAIGQAIAEKLGGKLLVGRDTRLSSTWIQGLLEQGLRLAGVTADDAGEIPTPAVALLTREGAALSEYSGGVMISASHNPFEDNGIKVFSSNGTKLTDGDEEAIERRVAELIRPGAEEATDTISHLAYSSSANSDLHRRQYERILKSHFAPGKWLLGRRVVMDCANGAMSVAAPELLRELGADVRVICATPDGRNINADCGAVHLEALEAAMQKETADFGVAFDGDGDRSLFVTREGKRVDGDAVLLVMAQRMKPSTVVGTSMTNYALEKLLQSMSIGLTRVAVGDRYVFEEMRRSGAPLGGEPSGHIIFSDFRLSGDGLLTTLKLAEAIVQSGKSLDELTREWVPAPQLLKGTRVAQKIPLEEMPVLQSTMEDANVVLKNCGRLVVRYSGTEPLLRVMIESDDANRNEVWMKKLLAAIEEDFKNRG